MATQPITDDNVSRATETKHFTGTIPYEILLNIMERCDARTLIRCQTLNRSTNQLISMFSHQIVSSVALRSGLSTDPIFTHDPQERLTVASLRRAVTANSLCRKICIKRFGKDVVRQSLIEGELPEKKKEIGQFLTEILIGCSVALRLINAKCAGEKLFADEEQGHSKTFNRKMTAHWRLESHIGKAQIAVLRNLRPGEMLSFKLFWHARAVAITPPGRFTAGKEDGIPIHRRRNRNLQRKEVHDPRDATWKIWTKQWVAGYLLDYGTPEALLKCFHLEDDPKEAPTAFEKLLGRISERHCGMSYEARLAHLERAQTVLDRMDKLVARDLAIKCASLRAPSQNQQPRERNLRILGEIRKYIRHLTPSGQPTIPFMSSQPFTETMESVSS